MTTFKLKFKLSLIKLLNLRMYELFNDFINPMICSTVNLDFLAILLSKIKLYFTWWNVFSSKCKLQVAYKSTADLL